MATATRTRKATAAKAKPAPEPVEEDLEELEDDEEFEEIEEAEQTATPAKKKGGAASAVTFGVADLATHLAKKTGKEVTTRELRALIRRLARDGSARVDRTIIAGNRSRYDWPLGLKDPEVVQIIKAFEGGEGEIEKTEKLNALKQRNAAKKTAAPAPAAKKAATKKAVAKKSAPEPELDEDDEDLDFGEDED